MRFDALFNTLLSEARISVPPTLNQYVEKAKDWERVLSISGYSPKAITRFLQWKRKMYSSIMSGNTEGSDEEKQQLETLVQNINSNIDERRQNKKTNSIKKYIKKAKQFQKKLIANDNNSYLVKTFRTWKNNTMRIANKKANEQNQADIQELQSIVKEIENSIRTPKPEETPQPQNTQKETPPKIKRFKYYSSQAEKKETINNIFNNLKNEFPNQKAKIDTIQWNYNNAKREDIQVNKLRSLLPDTLESMLRSILSKNKTPI